jgi:Protein of unknown function (DUF1810)
VQTEFISNPDHQRVWPRLRPDLHEPIDNGVLSSCGKAWASIIAIEFVSQDRSQKPNLGGALRDSSLRAAQEIGWSGGSTSRRRRLSRRFRSYAWTIERLVADEPQGKADQDLREVISHGRYVAFQMAEVAIPRNLFADILQLIALHAIFGSPNDMKFQSSMTLFTRAARDGNSAFQRALDRCCEGRMDEHTLAILNAATS